MNFRIDLVANRMVNVEANSRAEAVKIAEQQNPEFTAEYLVENENGSFTSIERCEHCNKPLFDDSQYSTDLEDGGNFCNDCIPEDYNQYIDNEGDAD